MDVKICPHCGSKISSKLVTCPNCGGRLRTTAIYRALEGGIACAIAGCNIGCGIAIGLAMFFDAESKALLLFGWLFALFSFFTNALLCGWIFCLRRNSMKLQESCRHMEYMILEMSHRNDEKYKEQEQRGSEVQR